MTDGSLGERTWSTVSTAVSAVQDGGFCGRLGMPVVATAHADIPEVVAHGETGFLAPERDVTALADHLLTLARSLERIVSMGVAGSERIRASFDADAQARRLEEIYDAVLLGR